MNLFIGVILDGFDAASASDHDVIKQEDFARFAHHWAQFDPRATCLISVQASVFFVEHDSKWIERNQQQQERLRACVVPTQTSPTSILSCPLFGGSEQDLHDFLQTLFAPWGFGKDYHASDREVRAHIRRLKLRIFNDNKVHFKASVLRKTNLDYLFEALYIFSRSRIASHASPSKEVHSRRMHVLRRVLVVHLVRSHDGLQYQTCPNLSPLQDVLLALSEEVHRIEAEKKGATIDLPQYFQAKASAEPNSQ